MLEPRPPEQPSVEQVRQRLTEEGLQFLCRLLAEFDPSRAAEERARLIAVLERMRHRLTDEE